MWPRAYAVALLAALSTGAALADSPPFPAEVVEPAAATVSGVMKLLGVTRLAADFVEQKHSSLLAKPLTTKGTLVYDREKGLVRSVTGARAQQVIVTQTTLTIKKGKRTETVPLAKSKDLKAFALVFPALLRGDQGEIAKSFDLAIRGTVKDVWVLTLTPKAASLKKLISEVTVIGKSGEVRELHVKEASGDHSEMVLSGIRTNTDVKDTELTGFASTP